MIIAYTNIIFQIAMMILRLTKAKSRP